ncbi:MAG: ImmA/IrrE family metallo-endopeptidase [Oscillospiraceae bacterium]|nr:ImmA/IrrE family metallo-endopeptidase [Oscillospiraceae bacterium]
MEKIIKKARELLLKQGDTSFKLDIPKMRFDKRIIFDTFQNYTRLTGMSVSAFKQIKDGCTVIKGDIYIVLTHALPATINSGIKRAKRINWTLAHEVGHVVLGHLRDGETEERQANSFASELLMPELLMLELRLGLGRELGVNEVSRLFGVSREAALNRIGQVEQKARYSAYLKNELIEKYRYLLDDYIEKNKSKAFCDS